MTDSATLRMKPYIQPFERVLAMRELAAVLGNAAAPVEAGNGLWTIPASAIGEAGDLLAYWESLGDTYTGQVWREATSLVARNGVGLGEVAALGDERIEIKIPRSRCLRYGPHGIHEYRGKFFPQLVKALVNIAGVRNGTVLDPMCGSGTTLVEATCAGNRAVGFDMNPLSVFISQVKCDAIHLSACDIVDGYEALQTGLGGVQGETPAGRRGAEDEAYLRQWFSGGVLAELDLISDAIDKIPHKAVAGLFRVSLSNIIRRVSQQKEEDLRVRREYNKIDAEGVRALFLEEALRSAKSVAADVAHGVGGDLGQAEVSEGDARSFVRDGRVEEGAVDLVITSPPYATALPYLDTDRLSLSYLGLLPRPKHRTRDGDMIGNREITDKTRRQQWERYRANGECLPAPVRSLIDRIERENGNGTVGFRRRNLGALLATYFFDMRSVLLEIKGALRPGGLAFLVVGNNRTTTPAGEIEIRTSELLLDMAEAAGFTDCERVEMEMLRSRDLFRENRTPSEHILTMRCQ